MTNRTAHIIVLLLHTISLSACTHSKLSPKHAGSSATLGIFLPNFATEMEDIRVPAEALSQLLPALAKAKHHDRDGSPHPQMKYVLTIRQPNISEQFCFFDDFTVCSFTLPAPEKNTVEAIVKELIHKENANDPLSRTPKGAR